MAEDAGVRLPSGCKQGQCSACVAKIISGEVDQSEQTFLSLNEVHAGYIVTCVAYLSRNTGVGCGVWGAGEQGSRAWVQNSFSSAPLPLCYLNNKCLTGHDITPNSSGLKFPAKWHKGNLPC